MKKVNLTLADHLISLAEAKPRKVGKSTYKSMNELLNAIKESGYNPEEDSPVAKVETPIKKSPKSAPPMTNGKVEHHEEEVSPPKPPQQKQATPPQQQQATPPQQQHQQQQQSPSAPQQQQQEVVPMPAAAVPVVQAAPVQPAAAQAAAPPPQAQAPPPAQQAQQATPMFPPPPHMSFVPQAQAAVPPTQQPSINFLQVPIFSIILSRIYYFMKLELPANLEMLLEKKVAMK